jgi:hypothetical protein
MEFSWSSLWNHHSRLIADGNSWSDSEALLRSPQGSFRTKTGSAERVDYSKDQ